ncbi:g11740 [Coccomyxa elongata]
MESKLDDPFDDPAFQFKTERSGTFHLRANLEKNGSCTLQSEDPAIHASINRQGSSVQRALSEKCPQPNRSISLRFGSGRKQPARSVEADPARVFGGGVPPLAIALLVCGTRGDVQPFLALGVKLREQGHRVRLASHAIFKELIQEHGLEFYPLGGDPQQLSAYMVENRGIIPSPTGYLGIINQRKQLKDIIWSCWPAVSAPAPDTPDKPFTAEAIIANPVCYGHIHCSEKLQVPLHMIFTMPWTPTAAFPHPMARMFYAYKLPNGVTRLSGKAAYYANTADAYRDLCRNGGLVWPLGRKLLSWAFKAEAFAARTVLRQIEMANLLSYHAVEDIVSTGTADLLGQFRSEVLELPTLYHKEDLHLVPFTYCFSPTLVPRPSDWPRDLIDIVGFFCLDGSKSNYKPSQELADFLARKDKPVYFGFGSLVVEKPQELTRKILKALAQTGQSAIISKGWGKLGTLPDEPTPPNVLVIDSVPHDYLFPRCAAVVHHGGAGTTASGLVAGCPTTIIPFFGDQAFWGEATRRAGVGPKPIPIDAFSRHKLVHALKFMARPEVKRRALKLAAKMRKEDGVARGVESFHRHLPEDYMTEISKKRAGLPTLPPRPNPPVLPAPPQAAGHASGRLPGLCLPMPALARVSMPSLHPRSWWTSSKCPASAGAPGDPQQSSNDGQSVALPAAASRRAMVTPVSSAHEAAAAGQAPIQADREPQPGEQPRVIRSLPSAFEATSQRRFSEDLSAA